MFTTVYYQVTPAGVATGKAMDKSPKRAMRKAIEASELSYRALCQASGGACLSVGVEGWRMWRGTALIGQFDAL